jgi:hypothetical protein
LGWLASQADMLSEDWQIVESALSTYEIADKVLVNYGF